MHVKANKKNKIQLYTVYKRIILDLSTQVDCERMKEWMKVEVKEWKIFLVNDNQKIVKQLYLNKIG